MKDGVYAIGGHYESYFQGEFIASADTKAESYEDYWEYISEHE